MTERPGSTLAARPLHFFIVADCSTCQLSSRQLRSLYLVACECGNLPSQYDNLHC